MACHTKGVRRLPIAMLAVLVACNGVRSRSGATAAEGEEARREDAVPERAERDAADGDEARWLRVATYNVNFGMAGDAETIERIRALDADVVFLQETHEPWRRALERKLRDVYPHMAFRKHSWPAGSLAVLSRHPIDDRALLRSRAGPFPAWLVVVDSPIGRVQILNVHLDPPVLRSRKQGWLQAYNKSQEVHVREIVEHVEHLEPDLPALIVGDFNEDLRGKAVRWLVDRGFSLAIEEFVPTWEWQTRHGIVRWQLDHVLCDPRLRFRNARVVEGGNSDHQPLLVEVALKSGP